VASKLNVLVVDDDRDVADVICQMLEARGHRCTIGAGGTSMRDALIADGFDAVILDALMPGEPSAALLASDNRMWVAGQLLLTNHGQKALSQGGPTCVGCTSVFRG